MATMTSLTLPGSMALVMSQSQTVQGALLPPQYLPLTNAEAIRECGLAELKHGPEGSNPLGRPRIPGTPAENAIGNLLFAHSVTCFRVRIPATSSPGNLQRDVT